MSRLEKALSAGRAVVPYLTASDPDGEGFLEAALGAVEGGARALEVGVPHSDPVADGPVIQRAHQRALASGGGLAETLALVLRLREKTAVPVALFTYLNPVLAFGADRFVREAREAGVDGVLTLDISPEEEPSWFRFLADSGLDPVVLLTPNTSAERASRLLPLGRGFVYLVSRTGVTGTHDATREDLARRAAEARSTSGLPLAVGFGVRTPRDARELWSVAEGVVVGSALIERLEGTGKESIREVSRTFVGGLASPIGIREGVA